MSADLSAWGAALHCVARRRGLVAVSEPVMPLAADHGDTSNPDEPVLAAARRLGLRAGFADPSGIAQGAFPLPIVVEGADGSLVVITALTGGEAIVIAPDAPASERRVPLDDLIRDARRVLHSRTAKPMADQRIDPYIRPYEPGWLREILTADLPSYGYVLLASLISNILALSGIIFSMQVYDRVVPAESMPTLVVLFIGVILAIGFDFALRRMRTTIVDVLGKRADQNLSDRVFGHALRVKMRARPRSTGSFIAQLRELEQVREVLGSTTIAAIADIPFFLLFAGIMWYLAGALVLVPLGALVLLVVPGLLVQGRLRAYATEAMREASLRNAMLVEAVQGIEDIKGLQAESRFQQQWNQYTAIAAEAQLKQRGLSNSLSTWSVNVQSAVYATIVCVGAPMVIAGDITTGVLVGASVLGSRMMAPMAHLSQVFSRLQQARIGAQSLDAIIQLPVDYPANETRVSLPVATGALALRHTRFGYGEQATQIALAVEDLTIKPGEKVALLGRNGAGKSTLLQGLSGLLDPIEGEVLIDGLNLAQVDPADARRAIGYVSSTARLFHGTIRENLTLGARFADDQQIMAALQLVRADQFVARLTAGLDHRLQEGGLGLSGGQVQALLLARMLIREPSVLLLDEPSAAMDDETERHFVTQFAAWSKGRTVVIATHRTRLLDLVDRVIVLNNGRIAADQSKARFLAMHGAGQQVSSGQAASVVKS